LRKQCQLWSRYRFRFVHYTSERELIAPFQISLLIAPTFRLPEKMHYFLFSLHLFACARSNKVSGGSRTSIIERGRKMKTGNDGTMRVAVIGYGLAGATFHAPLIEATMGMKVAAIVTGNNERQRKAREQYPAAAILKEVDEVWKNAGQYDLAVIATPNNTHVEYAIAAMQAGLPVVVDKPVARTVADGQRLLQMSQQTNQLLTIFQNRRWDNDFLTVQKILQQDMLGQVLRFESRYDRYRPTPRAGVWRESGDPLFAGGLLYDLGSHIIDQAIVLFGKPQRVYAEIEKRRAGVSVDDDTFIALQFANGVWAHLWMNQVTRVAGQRFRINGLKGTYEKWGIDPQEDQLKAGKRPGNADWGVEGKENWGRISTNVGDVHIDGAIETERGAYEQFYASMRDAIRGEGPVPVEPGEVINGALRVIEAAHKSANEGIIVQI
jgi:scyllo-inositol 2-dehydrogenase (NADP+)